MHKCLCSLRAACIVPGHFNDTATRLLFIPVPKQAPHFFVGLLIMSDFCLVGQCRPQLDSKVFRADLFLREVSYVSFTVLHKFSNHGMMASRPGQGKILSLNHHCHTKSWKSRKSQKFRKLLPHPKLHSLFMWWVRYKWNKVGCSPPQQIKQHTRKYWESVCTPGLSNSIHSHIVIG